MGFFERFKPESKIIKEEKTATNGNRDYSSDDARKELNQDLKTHRIIKLEDKLEPTKEDLEIIPKAKEPEDSEIIKNNIMLLMNAIDEDYKKIKNLENSIEETRKMEEAGDKPVISIDKYEKMIGSLKKEIERKEHLILVEEEKLTHLFSLN